MATRPEEFSSFAELMHAAKEAMGVTWYQFFKLYEAEAGDDARSWSVFQGYYAGKVDPQTQHYNWIAAASEKKLRSMKKRPILPTIPFREFGGKRADVRGINSARRKRPKPRSFAPAA